MTSEVWVWLWWLPSYYPAGCNPTSFSLTLILPLVSVLQTDFEKDVDLACRSGERLTGESHGGQSAHLLLSLFPASVCPTCPHPTPAATWPSLGSIPCPPPSLQESYGCEPQKAAVEPMLGWDHLWYPFTCLSVPFPLIGHFCVKPCPAPASAHTLHCHLPLPALPQAPVFCVVFVSSLLTWGGGGAGCTLRMGDFSRGRKERDRTCYWDPRLMLSFQGQEGTQCLPMLPVSGHSI